MRSIRTLVIAGSLLGALVGLTAEAWAASASSGGGNRDCIVNNAGDGALAIKGTLAVTVTKGIGDTIQEMDVTARLERSSEQKFLRLNATAQLEGFELNEEVVCVILSKGLEAQIQEAFMFGDRRIKLVGIDKSIVEDQDAFVPVEGGYTVNPQTIIVQTDGTLHSTVLGDITFYALKP